MKPHGMTFTADSVLKIAAGTKTQTRRIVSFRVDATKEIIDCAGRWYFVREQPGSNGGDIVIHQSLRCPHPVGTILYVREALTYWENPQTLDDFLVYMADGAKRCLSEWMYPHPIYDHCVGRFGKTISPMLMPKWAARYWLRVTRTRLERVNDISESDAQAEGCERPVLQAGPDFGEVGGIPMRGHPMTGYYRDAFRELWTKMHGAESWENDWVIAYDFERTEKPE